MTPAEHRTAAEQMTSLAAERLSGAADMGAPDVVSDVASMTRIAQVHATLALSPAAAPLPRPRPKPPARVEVFDVELNHLAVTDTPGGGVALVHPAADWSTLIDDPAQVRLLADTLTAHADRMENR